MRIWLGILALLTVTAGTAISATSKARLVLPVESARAGQTITVALELKMQPKWHTYWRSAGDAGAPTTIDWKLPNGITAGPIQWPVPEKLLSTELISYAYEHEVLLLVPLSLGSNLPAGPVSIGADVSWLECEEACVLGDAKLTASLVVGPEDRPSKDAPLIDTWKTKLPRSAPPVTVEARWDVQPEPDTRKFVISWPKHDDVVAGDFYPYAAEDAEVGHVTEKFDAGADRVGITKTIKKTGTNWPQRVAGLLVETNSATQLVSASEVELVLPTIAESAITAAISNDGPAPSLLAMLGLAFLGGLILNIMPCVLPVIALKVLGFINQSKEAPARVRQLGLIYMLGVLASFLVLAGLVIAVQQAGQLASWGMQFQNPIFLVAMTILVLLVSLNLFGLFEITLGGSMMGAAGDLAHREGKTGAFFNGVLATALATPCTAPFLGIALGFAFTQSAFVIVLIFLTIGLGLAIPYLLLSWWPALHRFLPKPGAWMEKFKIAMGFPMLATTIWLLWILTRHYGDSGVLWLGLFLTVLAMAAWIWGEFVQRGSRRRYIAQATSLVLIVGSYLFILEGQLHWRNPAKVTAREDLTVAGVEWKPWSPMAVEQARKDGRIVFVDFTAIWCATCKANKASSMTTAAFREKVKELNILTLIGDYSLKDDAITEQLLKFRRAGVPLNLVYPRNPDLPPIVLPTILSPGIVEQALEEAAKPASTAMTSATAR